METAVIIEKSTKDKVEKKTPTTTEGNSLKNIYGVGKGKIFYDESIFNFGKRKITV
jgi:hypothetical protein